MVQIQDLGVGSEKVSESPAHQKEGKEESGRAEANCLPRAKSTEPTEGVKDEC